jgi:hypothetical protein
MLAQGIDLADGRARGEQQLMEDDGVIERDARVQRQVEEGRASARDEEEDERIFAGSAQHGQRGAGRGEGVFVGRRVAALEVAKAPTAAPGKLVGAADAAQAIAAAHATEQHFKHGAGCLAQRDDHHLLVMGEADRIRPAAVGQEAMQRIALKAEAAVEGRGNATGLDSAGKNLSGSIVQSIEGEIADGSHEQCSFSQPASAACNGSS